MKTILRVLFVVALGAISMEGYAQFYLLPGTISHRKTADGSVINPDSLYRHTYYGAPEGAQTGFNSASYTSNGKVNGYIDVVLTTRSLASHLADSFPVSESWKFRMNGRLATPHPYKENPTSGELYPMLVFLHGAGERGVKWGSQVWTPSDPEYYNNDINLAHGGDNFLEASNRNPGVQNHWPGFIFVPQAEEGWDQNSIPFAIEMIKLLIQQYPVDPDRIYLNGLSNGGDGVFRTINAYPEIFAAAAPISGTSVKGPDERGPVLPAENTVAIPIWQFQGTDDNNPPPAESELNLDRLIAAGGTPRYTLYQNKGHAIWDDAWSEPDFYSWLLQYSKLTIHPYFGADFICEDGSQKLGISPGFLEYQWQRTADISSPTWNSFAPLSGQPNVIQTGQEGYYRVRFRRTTGWSDWSEPFELRIRPKKTPTILTNGSWELWGLNNNTSLSVYTPDTATFYRWYRNGVLYSTGATRTSILLDQQADQADYSVQYTDAFQCESERSSIVYANRAPFASPLPATPQNLNGTSAGDGSIRIWWDDIADDELGYEVYHSFDGANYTWLENIPANTISYEDTQLPGGTVYYRVRAFNQNGPSGEPTPLQVNLPEDVTPPATPANFGFARFSYIEHRIHAENAIVREVPVVIYDEHFTVEPDKAIFSWDAVEDNSTITYELYAQNGTLIGTTQDTSYMVTGLAPDATYSYYVKARDGGNQLSGASQTGQVRTTMTGLYDIYYEGFPWDRIKEYSINNYISIEHDANFDVSTNANQDYFAHDYIGYIYIPANASNDYDYSFRTRSDDGSSLWIGDEMVVDNDGLHGNGSWKSGNFEFPGPGAYPITVKFFERGGGNSLQVQWNTPGPGNSVNIPSSAFKSSGQATPPAPGAPSTPVANASPSAYSINVGWNYSTTPVDVVVLGSSTAAGTGATPGNSWVELFTSAVLSQNASSTVTNLAVSGFTTANVIASGNPANNITQALSMNPDFIIVNLPSNDAANGIDLATTMANFQDIKDDAAAANVDIYFTTSQPRNFPSAVTRQRLEDEAAAIRAAFGSYVIDTYAELATTVNEIKQKYNSGDGIHLNNAGHAYLYQQVLAAVGIQSLPLFEVYRSLSSSGPFEAIGRTVGRNLNNTNLLASTQYFYKVRAVTSSGVSNFSGTVSATTIGDSESPTTPTNFILNTKNETQVVLSWTASTDNVGVVRYEVEDLSGNASPSSKVSVTGKAAAPGSGMKWSTTSTTILINSGLEPAQNYEFTVRAYDAAGNYSPDASPTVSVTTSVPLPVEFLFVDHSITTNGVFIKWATATELNNAYFTVERGTGLDNFTALGGVDGNGTTSERHDYSFTDTNPLPLAYYRIKQTDYDGMFEYSKIIRVVYNDTDLPAFSVYPNPTTGENIHAAGYVPSTRSSVLVKMVDVMGRVHLEEEVDPNQFLNGMKINLTHPVPPGVYIIVISDGSSNTQRRVVIR